MKIKRLMLLVPVILGLSPSCSVRADRSGCPSLLSLSVSGGDEQAMRVFIRTRDALDCATISKNGDTATGEFDIPRDGSTDISVVSGLHGSLTDGESVTAPYGSDMDEIFAFASAVIPSGDAVSVSGTLHRQTALLFIDIVESDGEDYPYYVRVGGEVAGMGLFDLSPVPGAFSFMLHPVIGKSHRVCLPRQRDDSLSLEFFDADFTKADSAPVDKLPLGRYIMASGYDWTAEDLPDIHVSVDYGDAEVSVSVVPWQKVEI